MSKKKNKQQAKLQPAEPKSSGSMFGWAMPAIIGAVIAGLVVAGLSYVFKADSISFSFLVPFFAGFSYLVSSLLSFRKGEAGAQGFIIGWIVFVVFMPITGFVLQATLLPKGWELPIWAAALVFLILAILFTGLFFWRGWGAHFLPKAEKPQQQQRQSAGEPVSEEDGGDEDTLQEVTRGSKIAGTVLTNILEKAGWGNSGQLAKETLENERLRHTHGVLAEDNRARELALREQAAAVEKYRAAKADGVNGARLQVLFDAAYGTEAPKPAEEPKKLREVGAFGFPGIGSTRSRRPANGRK